MVSRRGAAKGTGSGYRNLRGFPRDPRVHDQSRMGIKQPQRINFMARSGGKARFTIPTSRNLEMNPDTYRLRRQVIDIIYDAKRYVNLPRIEVRVVENHPVILGTAGCRMNKCVIWISKRAIENSDLRTVVYHEILHTVYGIPHHIGDPMMNPTLKPMTKEESLRRFIRWTNRAKASK